MKEAFKIGDSGRTGPGGGRAMRPGEMRAANRRVVLDALRGSRSATRSELAARTSLTSQALGPILNELVEVGLVTCQAATTDGPGRPPLEFAAHAGGDLTLAMTIGRHQVAATLVDGDGVARSQVSQLISGDDDAETTVAEAAQWVRTTLVDEATRPFVRRIGLAIEGRVDPGGSVVSNATCWRDPVVDVAETVRRHSDLPIAITALDHAAIRGAVAHLQPDPDELVAVIDFSNLLTLSLLIGTQLLTNRAGQVGSLAHVAAPGNERSCACGRIGCLITVAGGAAFERRYQELTGQSELTAVELIRRVRRGDPDAITASAENSEWIVRAARPVLETIRPDRVVLTGAVGRTEGRGVQAIVEQLRDIEGNPGPIVEAVSSELHLAALNGAWAVAVEQLAAAEYLDAGSSEG